MCLRVSPRPEAVNIPPTAQQGTDARSRARREFHYRVPWLNSGLHPGAHRSRQYGQGQQFREFAPLLRYPDPRRIDLRTTLYDPMGKVYVRVFNQRSTVPVYVIADVSASMGFREKMAVLADFTITTAASARRTGDPFGFVACDTRVRMHFPATRRRGIAEDLQARLPELQAAGRNAAGIVAAVALLPRRRALVFLVSDFHLPVAQIEAALAALSMHDVVPVVLWHGAEYERLPRFGLCELHDPETGLRRFVLMRRRLRAKVIDAYRRQKQRLRRLCIAHGREPFFLVDRFEPDRLTEYFLTRA